MPLRSVLSRLALLACALLLACAPPGDALFTRLGEALRLRFPAQAARVLAARHGFRPTGTEFIRERDQALELQLQRG